MWRVVRRCSGRGRSSRAFIDSGVASFSAKTRCLDPTEGGAGRRDDSGVDANHSGLQRLTEPQSTRELAGVHEDRETIRLVGSWTPNTVAVSRQQPPM